MGISSLLYFAVELFSYYNSIVLKKSDSLIPVDSQILFKVSTGILYSFSLFILRVVLSSTLCLIAEAF